MREKQTDSPDTGHSRSPHSSHLPNDCKLEMDSDEEERKEKRTLAELREQLNAAVARAEEAERELEVSDATAAEWQEKVFETEHERMEAVTQLKEAQEELAKAKEELTKVNGYDIQIYQDLMAKYQSCLTKSLDNAKSATDAMEEARQLRAAVAQATEDLAQAKLATRRTEESLAEARSIILGLTSNIDLKIQEKQPLTDNEKALMLWRYPQHTAEIKKLNLSLDEKKVKIGLLECERDDLKLKLSRAQAGIVDSDVMKEMAQKLSDLSKENAKMREDTEQLMAKAEKGIKETELVITKLQVENNDLKDQLKARSGDAEVQSLRAENEDLNDRLRKLADRVDRLKQENSRLENQRDSHDHHSRPRFDSHHEKKRDRSHNSESDELRESVKRLEKTVEDGKWINACLEKDRNEVRASLKEKTQLNFQLQTDVDSLRTRLFTLEASKDELRQQMEAEKEKNKEIPDLEDKIKMLTDKLVDMEDERKQGLDDLEREKKRLQAELEEQQKMNTFLVTTTAGKLDAELKEANKKIKQLESELEKSGPGCSKEKRARLEKEVVKEPVPAPPFVLQAAAAAGVTPTEAERRWKSRFQPLQSPKAPVAPPHPAFAPKPSRFS